MWKTWFWGESIRAFTVLKPKIRRKRSCRSKAKLECGLLLLWITINSEIGEDVNITVLLQTKKKVKEQWAEQHIQSCLFFIHEFTSFPFFPPPLHQTDIYHWGASLSVSQGYLNTEVILKKERLSIQGDGKRIPMELRKTKPLQTITSWKSQSMVRKLPSLLRLQLRPHEKMCLFSKCLVWKLEEQGIRSGFLTGSPGLCPLPVAETWLVVRTRRESDISVWKRKIIVCLFF